MQTYHIHITGQVQGVGFRPHVHRLAVQLGVSGTVCNGADGVHIDCMGDEDTVHAFFHELVLHPPAMALITDAAMQQTNLPLNEGFYIIESHAGAATDVLITPDIAPCAACKRELRDTDNRRFQYAFTTCVHCGPRYSIIQSVPYDRAATTMASLDTCMACDEEYNSLHNRRYHSQTNSCPNCAIQLHFYHADGSEASLEQESVPEAVIDALKAGKILAVKGVGGYLLLCDATNELVINRLRQRKQRPAKPFALLYADINMLQADVQLKPYEVNALQDKAAPIVLCHVKTNPENNLAIAAIAPGLPSIGAMLPASPLLQLIADGFGKPLVATSANLSGSPIVYDDVQARNWLGSFADAIISYDRMITAPQDDSVLQFTDHGQKILLRRSRGLAPNYHPVPFDAQQEILATGAELKSAFAITKNSRLFVSQFLGDQSSVEAQDSFAHTYQQIADLLQFKPTLILADAHPGYSVQQLARELAANQHVPFELVQHHEAHFAAVLAENNLLNKANPVLGFIWDGTGYGHDQQIWGGELFLFERGSMERIAQLDYFPQLMGDKMSKEPRLSALSLLAALPVKQHWLKSLFTETEWHYYQQQLQQPGLLQTSSMGRLIDAVSCMLGVCTKNTYEGEAAMKLEALAKQYDQQGYDYYSMPLIDGKWYWQQLLEELIEDWLQKEMPAAIAWKFFNSLAIAIAEAAHQLSIDDLAFSGGVFQNALLTDLIVQQLQYKRRLHFHQQLSPNDECIGFGQLAWWQAIGKQQHAKAMQMSAYTKNYKQSNYVSGNTWEID